MQEIEDKTGLIRRFMQMQPKIAAIEEAAQKIKTLNYRQYENPRAGGAGGGDHGEHRRIKGVNYGI